MSEQASSPALAAIGSRRKFLRASGLALCGAGLAACERPQHAPRLHIVEQRQTRFGLLAVVDRDGKRYLAYGPDTRLVYQSVLDLERPHELAAPYMRLMMLGLVYAGRGQRVALIGTGAGNMAGYLVRNFPEAVVDAVDIDRHAVELGMRYFGLQADARLRLHTEDGRAWLAASRDPFDVVMLDAYDERSIPPSLADEAFFSIVAARLAAGGVVMQNAYLGNVEVMPLVAAMRASFAQVDSYRVADSVVLAAYQGPARAARDLQRRAQQIDAALRPLHPLTGQLARRVPA